MTTLYINRSDSKCGACGKNADPAEAAHDMVRMIGVGCGATFTDLGSHYPDFEGMHDRIRSMRPDLPFNSDTFGGAL